MGEEPEVQGRLERDEDHADGAAAGNGEEEEAAAGGIREGRAKRNEVLQSFLRAREDRRNRRQN
jgi:hypothetical protein